ncbi:hypothetical protein PIB30_048016 [Stylosanthes scabra]|uniref:Aminotransferase-like plant mobile domain-containing protein n=1 Tax=Stylosanthes scabra TaxID=79078 RepID=A0ABU6XFY0_9FABA|nr:hypothetical protein [Stylosanthes scabra]
MFVRFHHVDHVKRQFGSEQPIPSDPVNLDRFFGASARGEDKWWLNELDYWYNFWNNRRAREHQIQIVYTPYIGWPTKEYIDWWVVAYRRRFLSEDRMLHDPRGVQLPDDVPPATTQSRDLMHCKQHCAARMTLDLSEMIMTPCWGVTCLLRFGRKKDQDSGVSDSTSANTISKMSFPSCATAINTPPYFP